MEKSYDVIVVGGGHAGIEAANIAANLGCSVAMVTMDKHAIGRMSCNPAIGGTAKGHLVREVDALGGLMGKIADRTGIQFRMLNRSKGPAVWSPRCQSDRKLYSEAALQFIEANKNIDIIEDSANEVVIEGKKVSGIITSKNGEIKCKALVLSTGTFLNGLMHTGLSTFSGGRFGEQPATGITESLVKAGFEASRLKTGTPPRLHRNSIDWSVLEEQPGDENPQPFSFQTPLNEFPYLPQVSCHITYTDISVHKTLEKGFGDSPLFSGRIKGVGPRYCPSIEDKIVRFADKEKHQLFLEPEGLDSDLIYVNGFSTSLPAEVQLEAIHKIKGLEHAEMIRPGYAVEYDFFPPHQVDLTLETKLIDGLYFSGQINGTSGYEEAAAQGLIAGMNAALKVQGKPEFVLKRSEAYTGVLIDDLVTKSTEEPYRMFTSRAEHRLLLRQDNADQRLYPLVHPLGLIPEEHYLKAKTHHDLVAAGVELFGKIKIHSRDINKYLSGISSAVIDSTETISKLCKRPEMDLKSLMQFVNLAKYPLVNEIIADNTAMEQIETELKYEGYIKREYDLVERLEKYEDVKIPLTLNYSTLNSISREARDKLNKIKPRSIGQAARISGVTPSDISILLVYLRN